MSSGPADVTEHRSAVAAAREAFARLAELVHQCSGDELAEVMEEVDAAVAQGVAVRAVVAAEAVRRGMPGESGVNAHAWVRAHAPSLRQGGAGQLARLASEVAVRGRAGSLAPDAAQEPDPGSALGILWASVKDAKASPSLALGALGEVARLAPRLREEVLPTVARGLVEVGVAWGPGQMRRLRPRLLAQYGRHEDFDDLQARLATAARLSVPVLESGDLTEYQLVMTPEQAAVLEAAIGPLSAPAPNEQTGERDLRPAGQRRVEALAEVCRRSAALDISEQATGDAAAGSAAALHVIMSLVDLEQRTGAGEVLGSTATGVLLSPEVLRRVACDADLVPHVLGSSGEDLDLGRVVRLFTRAQRRRLWRRDRGCTYPGCTAPAAWTRAHHVLHWVDGGNSDVDNAALLCQRHHTFVHRRRLVGRGARKARQRGPVRRVGPGSGLLRPMSRHAAPRTGAARPTATHPGTTAAARGRPHQRRRG